MSLTSELINIFNTLYNALKFIVLIIFILAGIKYLKN